MSVLKLPLLVPSTESRKISSFHNFLSLNNYFRKYFKLVCLYVCVCVVMETLSTSITFLLFTCMHFRVWGILWGWSRVCRPPMKWFMITKSLRNTALRNCFNALSMKTMPNIRGTGLIENIYIWKFAERGKHTVTVSEIIRKTKTRSEW
jgi:hypothetical protein